MRLSVFKEQVLSKTLEVVRLKLDSNIYLYNK